MTGDGKVLSVVRMTDLGMLTIRSQHPPAFCEPRRRIALQERCEHPGPWGIVHTGHRDHLSFDFVCNLCGYRWEP